MQKKYHEGKMYKWEILLLLWMAYLLNQGDRQVFNTVLPAIRDSLNLTDTSIGLIATIFNLAFAVMVPVGGWMGDRFSRKWVVTISVLFFSVATMFTGLAGSFFWLLMLRSVCTGGGEAMFGPSNYSILAQYHTDTRARAMSIHQTAYYIGVILAGWLAGLIADHFGWKYSFFIFGGAGIIWGLLILFRMDDRPIGNVPGKQPEDAGTHAAEHRKPGFFDGFKAVFTCPTALMMTIGFSGLIFVITGFMTWVPAYLQEEFGMSQADSGFHSMFWTYVAAFVGVLLAGSLSDRLALKDNKYRMYLQAAGLVLGSLFLFFMGGKGSLLVMYICFAGWGFFRAFFDANTYSVLYDVTPEHLHASCGSVMGMTGFAVGSLAPVILGAMKQSLGSLSAAFPVLGIIWVVCGVLMFIVARISYKKDHEKARV
ncbi:MAG: MFS transporter [Bacteroidales bacterium]|nr:MFS transporter [Bacteroidales bacterium]